MNNILEKIKDRAKRIRGEILQNHIIKKLYDKFIIYDILFFVLSIGITYALNNLSIFFILMCVDGMNYVLDFFINSTRADLTRSEILTIHNKLYEISGIERMMYYMLCNITYIYLSYFTFNSEITWVKYILSLTIIPIIFNTIIMYEFEHFFTIVKEKRQNLLKEIFIDQVSNIIIKLEELHINGKNVTNKYVLSTIINNIEDFKSNVSKFIKNILLTFLLIYLRKYYNKYYVLVKYYYKTQGEEINDITLEEARNIFTDVIRNQEFDKLNKPIVVQSIIYLYYYNDNGTSIIKDLTKKIKWKFATMLCLWTIGSYFNNFYLPLVLMLFSSVLTIIRKDMKNTKIVDLIEKKIKINLLISDNIIIPVV